MEQFTVTGMSCAACQARVEKAVSKVEGVKSCSVSLLTNSMGVEGSASPAEIIAAVENAGYGAALKGAGGVGGSAGSCAGGSAGAGAGAADGGAAAYQARLREEEDALRDRETPVLKRRLVTSLGFLAFLMYFSMGHMMFGFPIPKFFHGNPVAMGLLQLLLAAIVMVINQKFFVSGFRSLLHGAPNMDTLIALGSSAAFIYSTVMLFAMTGAQAAGDGAAAAGYMKEFYFESAAMILSLITVGKMLEARSKGKTTSALRSLMELAPKTACVLRDGQELTLPVEQVRKDDIFLVRPGETVPVDGEVLEGESAVNEAALTGESLPVDKVPGDLVSSATLNQSGVLKCRATRVGEDTTLAQIIRMVSDAAATKAPVAKLADRISGVFVPAVILIALATTLVWLLLGQSVGFALARGICVLVVSCPCALGLATPVAIMVGSGVGAGNGILFKTAEALQETGNIQIAALDKTGTITRGDPRVTDLVPAPGRSSEELIRAAAALEQNSEHPLSRAVMLYAEEQKIPAADVTEFQAVPGRGLTARLGGRLLRGGNDTFIGENARIPAELLNKAGELASEGKTPLWFSEEDSLLGVIAVADTIREDSPEAVKALRNLGIHVVMLTGDNQRTAEAIGRQAGVSEVISGVLPDGKEAVIRALQEKGTVAMVGDGINDAPALTRANIGIAIGAGTDVAIDAADVVLMKSSLRDAAAAIRLSRATYRNIVQNLFWALFYNTLLIPAAAGLYVRFGITMNPMLGAAAMSLSSFCVVSNALRLNLLKIHDGSGDRPGRHPVVPGESGKLLEPVDPAGNGDAEKEDTMKKTMQIEGMMCMHCEARVKKVLEALPGVESAEVSHEKGTAVVTMSSNVADSVLKETVEAQDYKVLGIAE